MSQVTLHLSRQKLLVKPDGPLPKFYPPPKLLMVTPIYDDKYQFSSASRDDEPRGDESREPRSNHHHSSYRIVDRSRSHRRSHSQPRVHTRSDNDNDDNETSPHRSSSHGREYTPPPRRNNYRRERRRPRHSDSHPHAYPQNDFGNHTSRYDDYPQQVTNSSGSGSARPRDDFGNHAPRYGGHPQQVTNSTSSSGNAPGHVPASGGYAMDRGMLDDAIQKYFRLLPPAHDFCWSRCTGKKKAVCIGINYVGQKDELNGCANDARNMRQFLMDTYDFKSEDIMLLIDDGHGGSSARPTRKEMFGAMNWLVQGAQRHDSLFFHYSGHGGQTPDKTGREADGQDEVIFPVDFHNSSDIIDDELHQALVQPLPAGCRLTALFDSCHSGTVLDLPYLHSAHGRLRGLAHISQRAKQRGASAADVLCFAACKDDETSADTFHGDVATGAMSYEFIHCLRNNPHQIYDALLGDLRKNLIPKYHQKAQISGSHPVDLSREFTL